MLCGRAPSSLRRKPTTSSFRLQRSPCLSFNFPPWGYVRSPPQKIHCVVVSCAKVRWCRKMSALRWPWSKRSAPSCFLTGRRRVSRAGSITRLQKWYLEKTWQIVWCRVHDAHSLHFTKARLASHHHSFKFGLSIFLVLVSRAVPHVPDVQRSRHERGDPKRMLAVKLLTFKRDLGSVAPGCLRSSHLMFRITPHVISDVLFGHLW